MKNIRLVLSYDGTRYAGWQTQSKNTKAPTIQAVVEKTLQSILGERVRLTSSGRTDSGVHASAQVANFRTKNNLSLVDIQNALNSLLPYDIVVTGACSAKPDFHARFNAKAKIYSYTILNSSMPDVFLQHTCWWYRYPLKINRMRKSAKLLVGKHDFSSFSVAKSKRVNNTRTIHFLRIEKKGDWIHIRIKADGFLHKMVRTIIGTLVEVGRGHQEPNEIKKILKAKDRRKAGPTAPAKGLCLEEVIY